MTRSGFVLANLGRRKTRTVLTLLSIVMAFLLFGLLQAVNVLFAAGADFVGATRLVTQARVSFTQSLPMRRERPFKRLPRPSISSRWHCPKMRCARSSMRASP